MVSSGRSLTSKELKTTAKNWYLAMSWNAALGGICNEPKRTADFNKFIGIFPPASLSLLHCRDMALNFPHLIHAILQKVPRGCVQTPRAALGLEKSSQAAREGIGRQVLYSHSPHTPGI